MTKWWCWHKWETYIRGRAIRWNASAWHESCPTFVTLGVPIIERCAKCSKVRGRIHTVGQTHRAGVEYVAQIILKYGGESGR